MKLNSRLLGMVIFFLIEFNVAINTTLYVAVKERSPIFLGKNMLDPFVYPVCGKNLIL
jgi:hypothetical protein